MKYPIGMKATYSGKNKEHVTLVIKQNNIKYADYVVQNGKNTFYTQHFYIVPFGKINMLLYD